MAFESTDFCVAALSGHVPNLLVYWTTGVQKVSAYWVPGGDFSALYFIGSNPHGTALT